MLSAFLCIALTALVKTVEDHYLHKYSKDRGMLICHLHWLLLSFNLITLSLLSLFLIWAFICLYSHLKTAAQPKIADLYIEAKNGGSYGDRKSGR